NANCTISTSPRQAEHALSDDVALDLVGAGIDRPGQREVVAVEPLRAVDRVGRIAHQLALGPQQTQGSRMDLYIELAPEDLHQARFGAHLTAAHEPRGGVVRVPA